MLKLLEEFGYYFHGARVNLLGLLPCVGNGLMDFDSPYQSTIEIIDSTHVLWTLQNVSFPKRLRFVIGDTDFCGLFHGENVFELGWLETKTYLLTELDISPDQFCLSVYEIL